jgi:hypothetical protein
MDVIGGTFARTGPGSSSTGFRRALKHSKSVKQWRDGRFAHAYPGFVVDVLDAHGQVAHGRTLLGTVRDGYLEDE